ncbi:unnamed protein product [Ceratitis capitata]|uniref:(Mediterranean fruit fly) hypothetical protein n=1 Tax=Ceratitis capitata TaxID=7213 RepID=A0A811U9N5_CERCA|nr:unnamed protein product [Ceratitis capitata]
MEKLPTLGLPRLPVLLTEKKKSKNHNDEVVQTLNKSIDAKIPLHAGSKVYVSKHDLAKIFIPNACIYTSRLSELVFGSDVLENISRSNAKQRLLMLDENLLKSIINLKYIYEDKNTTTYLQYATTQRGRVMLVYNGYRYVENRQSHKNIFWRCSRYVKYGCRATVVTSKLHDDVSAVRVTGAPHTHDQEVKTDNIVEISPDFIDESKGNLLRMVSLFTDLK